MILGSTVCQIHKTLASQLATRPAIATVIAVLAFSTNAQAQCVASACTVQTTADSTGGPQTSLRDAIVYANANPGTTITFSGAIANQTITLGSMLPLITGNNTIINGGGGGGATSR